MKRLLIIVVLMCISTSLSVADNTYYFPEGSIKERLKERIEYSQRCIDLHVHDFAALGIDEYLEAARNRGVRVRIVIIESSDSSIKGLLAETLIRKGFDTRVLKLQLGNEPIQDFVIFDDRVLVTGVYNWLAYRDRNVCNDVIFHQDQNRICTYKDTFCKLFTEGEVSPFLNNQGELIVSRNPTISDVISGTATVSRNTQDSEIAEKTVIVEEPAKPVAETLDRDFIDVSIEEMNKHFGKESALSRSEKNELWNKYRGKYVRWRGIAVYKGMGRVDWNRIGVSRQPGKDAEVEILFDWRMFEKVMDVRIGSTITYTGKLLSRPVYDAPYRLDDGDIE